MVAHRVPSLNWLRVFEAAARTGSFVGAARLLNMTAPAVSKQVRALETHLGQPLFERQAQGVVLTPTGRALAPRVRQSLFGLDAAVGSMFGKNPLQAVTVAMPLVLACGWMAEMLPRFERARPDIRVHVRDALPPQTSAADLDLQIVFGDGIVAPGDCDRLFGETLYPIAAREIAAKIDAPADLAAHRLIDIGMHRTGWVEVLGRFADIDLGALELTFVDSTAVALSLAAAGDGIALARAPATDFLAERLGLVPVKVAPPLDTTQAYFLVCASRQQLTPAAKALRSWLLQEAAR